jgi:hypothetical protein
MEMKKRKQPARDKKISPDKKFRRIARGGAGEALARAQSSDETAALRTQWLELPVP